MSAERTQGIQARHALLLPPETSIQRLLDETDEFAAQNVLAAKGGPFGASFNIYNIRTGELINVGGLRANAVLSTGIASAHAEDQALAPDIVSELKKKLVDMDTGDISVIMASSAESCPACHAKEEIIARDLICEGLLLPDRFFVVYGATYQDSKDIAGFNDEPYHLDMQKTAGTGMIKEDSQKLSVLPSAIAGIFSAASQPVAVVVLKDGTLITGYDESKNDLRSTAEASAIRGACRYQKNRGMDSPWDLGGAQLYTATYDIGPLGYAEAQWANVTKWTAVELPPGQYDLSTHETSGASNHQLFQAVAARPTTSRAAPSLCSISRPLPIRRNMRGRNA